ncbi:hypothetical protein J1G44_07110 [Cellulomonas sp. zg-ZUI199]|uniref:DUF3592 domain-containing protein n=1 Tax=Cellulomonas wangleii TaxID=2816956 RepID=A0ABX8D926_9CELL|nr:MULTISPECIES: hypothetical protein [Cellulomonas]MBO0898743.1 hypothetical protein [Cellulomonas sp. zg-ZUI22]MBO0923969.1 hypothetical protein [Cellulomonas wangleii]MBO0924251.1 hypothetical protein [Cellulomonas wangleii]QVI62262.1 hypothetical protein KG103_17955 [Cellulomonas wangleii]
MDMIDGGAGRDTVRDVPWMGRGARAVVVLLALVLAGVGGVGGAVVHWFVVQPSDDELRAAAADLPLHGFRDVGGRGISGRWAPSFDRGSLHWDAVSESVVTTWDVADALRDEGWTVEDPGDGGVVHGRRDRVVVDVRPWGLEDGGTTASIAVGRGDVPPSPGLTAALGAAVGALLGVLGGVLGGRALAARHGPGSSTW